MVTKIFINDCPFNNIWKITGLKYTEHNYVEFSSLKFVNSDEIHQVYYSKDWVASPHTDWFIYFRLHNI